LDTYLLCACSAASPGGGQRLAAIMSADQLFEVRTPGRRRATR